MKKCTHLVVFLVAATVLAASGTALGGLPYVQLAEAPTQLPDGNWEYVYDVYGDNSRWINNADVYGFDATQLVNQWPTVYDGVIGIVAQHWDRGAVFPDFWNQTAYGSYSDDGTTWTLHGQPWTIENRWHSPSEYVGPGWYRPGTLHGDGVGHGAGQGISFGNKNAGGSPYTGLLKTFRLVHPNAPAIDGILYYIWSYTNVGAGVITGPSTTEPTTPGDFDDDGDIDGDDIGDLCANITGSGNPPNDPKYDLDGDGDTDQVDMDILIHDLVEITGGDGTGTEYGDFDLDGDIDTTDLTILATNFGLGTTWSEGNANCDLVIDTTDLAIMATNFGFVASGAVPEPATLSLLAVGSAALIRRRRATP